MLNVPKISQHTDIQRIPINQYAFQDFKAGDIVSMDFGDNPYSMMCGEQIGQRPVIILKNNISSKCPLLEVVKLTRKVKKKSKWHLQLDDIDCIDVSTVLIEQHGSYSRERVTSPIIGNIGPVHLKEILEYLHQYIIEE